MTKRERLEDLGKLAVMLKDLTEMDIFEDCQSKHAYETWLNRHIQRDQDDQAGLYDLHCKLRHLQSKIEDCWCLAEGEGVD